mgnify:CR=1 FL=1
MRTFRIFFIAYAAALLYMLLSWDIRTLDYAAMLLITVLIYAVGRHYRISPNLIAAGMMVTLPHAIGILGPYSLAHYDFFSHLFALFFLSLYIAEIVHAISGCPRNLVMFFILLFATIGISALHEIVEFLGYKLLGTGNSVFQMGSGDFTAEIGIWQNSMIDMLFGTLGASLGLLLWFWRRCGRPRDRSRT